MMRRVRGLAARVDLRSDTVTKPTEGMREAMRIAEVGDDVLGADPTVAQLEEKVAQMLNKEAAVFVPSGTQANLCAVMAHCWGRSSEYIVGDAAHIYLYEQGGGAVVGGSHPRVVQTEADGTLDLKTVESLLRPDDPHFPVSTLLCLENTHNVKGGTVLPMSYMKEARKLCDDAGLKLHLDGARLWHAAHALNVSIAETCADVDSVSVCLSKALGAPVGSLLLADADTIAKARRLRKLLGGAMRQSGVLAAAGLIALDEQYPELYKDHQRAAAMADAILSGDLFSGDTSFLHVERYPETNILFLNLDPHSKVDPSSLVPYCTEEHDVHFLEIGKPGRYRLVFHHQVDDAMLERTFTAFKAAHSSLST